MKRHNISFLISISFSFVSIVYSYFMIDTMGFGFEHEGLLAMVIVFLLCCIAISVYTFIYGSYELDRFKLTKENEEYYNRMQNL